jgi:hypothetical protein
MTAALSISQDFREACNLLARSYKIIVFMQHRAQFIAQVVPAQA